MLKLLDKEIDLIKSGILFNTTITPDNFPDHWNKDSIMGRPLAGIGY
jgi:hypothetical protein